jgi:eukaryotic-like serine/threonine-protein kinase
MSSVTQFLSTVNGFNGIASENLDAIADQIEAHRLSANDHLIRRGEAGDRMYIIRSGRVRVPILEKESGKTKLVVHLGPGDLVGEMALLTGERRNADVIADTDLEVLSIDRETLQPLLSGHPPLARFLTEILGRRLEEGGGIGSVGKYRLLGKLGEGATAKVYNALHPGLNRVVAVKMLSHALVYDSSFKERFLQEARTIAGLTHPNIVQIFDTEARYATYFIVMEKVSGTDLAKMLKARKVLAPEEAMAILRQMCAALQYAHGQGIVHRDVKPANCAVDESGAVKLMDFGIARRIQKSPTQKRAKMVEGTPRYLAPEAAVGKPVDGRADIYSLGIMAFEMVTGRVPFYSETIRELLQMHVRRRPPDITRIRSGLPEGLVEFINGALVKRPDERLTDWDRIQSLLSATPGVVTTSQPFEQLESELISIRYKPDARADVADAMNELFRRLGTVGGVEVSHARMVPVRTSDTPGGGVPSTGGGGSVTGKGAAQSSPGRVDEKEWMSRLAASTRKGPKGTPKKKVKGTRAMDTLE